MKVIISNDELHILIIRELVKRGYETLISNGIDLKFDINNSDKTINIHCIFGDEK